MEQSTPAWRVFDQPATAAQGSAAGTGSPAPGDVGRPSAVALASPNILLAAAAVIGALLIGGVGVIVAMSGGGAGTIEGPPTAQGTFALESAGPVSGELVVDVAGAVALPGLYHLAPGSRVGDAVDAAGGFGPRVDVARVGRELNLAAPLTDGQQIRVPSRDDPAGGSDVGGGSGGGGGSASTGGSGSGGSAVGALVNLNSATQSELEALPGIGPVTAAKIIAAREEALFRSVDELRERGLVGEKTFGELKALVTVG